MVTNTPPPPCKVAGQTTDFRKKSLLPKDAIANQFCLCGNGQVLILLRWTTRTLIQALISSSNLLDMSIGETTNYFTDTLDNDSNLQEPPSTLIDVNLKGMLFTVEGPYADLRSIWLGEENARLFKSQQAATDNRQLS